MKGKSFVRAIPIGVREFDSRKRLGIFLFSTASRPALGPTYPMGTGGLFNPEIKRPAGEADH
jgi:hypothetical protein